MERLFPILDSSVRFQALSYNFGPFVRVRTAPFNFKHPCPILDVYVFLDLARSDVGRSCAISNDSGGFQLPDTNVFFVLKKTTSLQAVTILVTKAGRKK